MVRIVFDEDEFRKYNVELNKYRKNKIAGEVLERYTKKILEDFLSVAKDRVLFRKTVSDIISEAGFSPSKSYAITIDTLPPSVLVYQRGSKFHLVDYLRNICYNGKGRFTYALRNYKFRRLNITRLDIVKRRPDFIIVTENNNVFIVDCKYRSAKYTITYGDLERIIIYAGLLKKALRGLDVGTPILVYNVANPKALTQIRYGVKNKLKNGVSIRFNEIFLKNYLDKEEHDDYIFYFPTYILSKKEVYPLLGKVFNIVFIEWLLYITRHEVVDEITVKPIDEKHYIADSKILGLIHKGVLGSEKSGSEQNNHKTRDIVSLINNPRKNKY